jgi:uncharacterized protein
VRRLQGRAVHGDGEKILIAPPEFPLLKEVGLEDRPLFMDALSRFPSEACEMTFANIFIWREFERPRWTIHNGNICVLLAPPSESSYFLPPIGGNAPARTVDACLELNSRLSRVPEASAIAFGGAHPRVEDPDNFDYVYRSADLIGLAGKKYDGKRNRIRKFERLAPHAYFELGPEHLGGCRRLFEEWFNGKEDASRSIGPEKGAILQALEHFEALGLRGGAVEVDGRIQAFSIGEPLSPDTAVIHIEIANPEYPGLAQFINREFARNTWSAFPFINREQDIGHPGIRRAKMSYHPHHLVRKYSIRT